MKIQKPLLATALLAPALIAFCLPRDAVTFSPAAGSAITKNFTFKMVVSVDELDVLMNGEPNPMMPEMETESTTTQTVVVKDEYVAVADGVPTKLHRTFETIDYEIESSLAMAMGGESDDFDMTGSGTSGLEGMTVAFEWDADQEAYQKTFLDDEGDSELLEPLTEDMDLRALLPDGEVSEGDTWDIDLDSLPAIFFPGGEFAFEMESGGDEPPMPGMDPTISPHPIVMWDGDIEGSARGTYTGTREVDGATVGIIAVAIEVDTASDLSDFYREIMGEILPEGLEATINSMDHEIHLEGKGELLWDLRGGHVHAFQFESDVALVSDSEMEMAFGGQSMTMEESTEASGTFVITVDLE